MIRAICTGGYPDIVGIVLEVYFDSLCEIDGTDERVYRASPPQMNGTLERYFRERHLSFLPPEGECTDDTTEMVAMYSGAVA